MYVYHTYDRLQSAQVNKDVTLLILRNKNGPHFFPLRFSGPRTSARIWRNISLISLLIFDFVFCFYVYLRTFGQFGVGCQSFDTDIVLVVKTDGVVGIFFVNSYKNEKTSTSRRIPLLVYGVRVYQSECKVFDIRLPCELERVIPKTKHVVYCHRTENNIALNS